MKTTWVVVADEAIARILQWPEVGDELESVEELTDPAAHASGADLRRDAEGRRAGSAPHGGGGGSEGRGATSHLRSGGSVTASAGEDGQHLEAERFAKQVAERLAVALQQKRFDELRIVAAPRFLGLLRKAMKPELAGVVTDELNKDLVHMQNRELTAKVFPSGAPGRPSAET